MAFCTGLKVDNADMVPTALGLVQELNTASSELFIVVANER